MFHLVVVALATVVMVGLATAVFYRLADKRLPPQAQNGGDQSEPSPAAPQGPPPFVSPAPAERPPRTIVHGNLALHWEPLPAGQRHELAATAAVSNIRPQDYAGPESCRKCHERNYANWSRHPHRFMNALAGPDTVKGDFSGQAGIEYQGARGSFYREGDQYRMRIERRGKTHVYRIYKTLGSRFFQYYIGRGVEGPPPQGHHYYGQEHVLPFGYWIDRRMWVPVVHVADELPDEGGRWNPLDPPRPDEQPDLVYADRCSFCHTTYPIGDNFVRHPEFMSQHLPVELHFSVAAYTAQAHPELWDGTRDPAAVSNQDMSGIIGRFFEYQTPDNAATLGISCEACHLGAKAHAEDKQAKPSFRAQSEHLMTSHRDATRETGPVHHNVNWVCSRCHVGGRPEYACGAATWNSVEYSDAARGACYSELTCVHCHEPHTPIGQAWSQPPDKDDAVCLSCHQQYQESQRRQQHTRHPAGSPGDRCFNCHMPRINEGLQDAVRTHMIFSPTRADMIEAGHPNACNLCHLDQPIDWTRRHLEDWYGKQYHEARIAASYPHRDQPVGIGWLKHPHEATRLAATDAMTKARAAWGLAALLDVLDDEYLLNRQFAQKGLEDMLDIRLIDWEYRFYMTAAERREPLARLRAALLQDPPE